jgi:hypothetical protein
VLELDIRLDLQSSRNVKRSEEMNFSTIGWRIPTFHSQRQPFILEMRLHPCNKSRNKGVYVNYRPVGGISSTDTKVAF